MKSGSRQLGENGEQASRALIARCIDGSVDQKSGIHDIGADLVAQFHAADGGALSCRFQIKTGESYAERFQNRWKIKNISRADIDKWKKSRDSFFLVWAKSAHDIFFVEINQGTIFNKITISDRAIVFPSFITELRARVDRASRPSTKLFPDYVPPPLSENLRDHARKLFRKFVGNEYWHPVLGKVRISWSTWRHLTRQRRKPSHIHRTLELVGCLPTLIGAANKLVAVRRIKLNTIGQKTFESRLFVYRTEKIYINGKWQIIVVTMKETTIAPKNWSNLLDLNSAVQSQLTLESIYPEQ